MATAVDEGFFADLGEAAEAPGVERLLALAREFLDMDVAYTSAIDERRQHIEELDGDGSALGLRKGLKVPIGETFCRRVLDGEAPNLVPDAKREPALVAASPDSPIRGFASVPITLQSGEIYGTLCCASAEPTQASAPEALGLLRTVASMVAGEIERERLQHRLNTVRMRNASISALMLAVEARDGYTGEHSHSVVRRAGAVAKELDLSNEAVARVEEVALLHDIGKLAMPDNILRKPGPLDDSEWRTMREHSPIGAQMVERIPGLEHLGPAIRAEHERWDGSGYPDGLRGEDIPLESRIVLVCDAYDAMTSDRSYRDSLPDEDAIRRIREGMGSQFDPEIADALISVLRRDRA